MPGPSIRPGASTPPGAPAPRDVQRRQWLLLAGIVGAVLAVTALSVLLTTPDGPRTSTAKPKPVPIMAPGAQVDPRDAWRGQADAQLKSIELQSKSLAQRNTELEAQSKAMLDRLQRLESGSREAPNALDDPGLTPLPPPPVSAPAARPQLGPNARGTSALGANASGRPAGTRAAVNVPPPVRADALAPGLAAGATGAPAGMDAALSMNAGLAGSIISITLADAPASQDTGQAVVRRASAGGRPPQANRNGNVGSAGSASTASRSSLTNPSSPSGSPAASNPISNPTSNTSSGPTVSGSGKGPVIHDVGSYLPSGTFTRALLLGGLDAPTGGQAQRDPQPVLLRLVDQAVLPNRWRSRVKECFVVGAGYGDVSAERAYVRTESLSCVTHQGQVLDLPIRGYVAGEDGKAGLRGRLVSKQGQILANAPLAGVASGIGSAFQQNATTVAVSPLGSTASVDPGKQFEAGLGTGVGKAMDRLAQYYISLAEKVFPVIEVDAGRTVDVVLTQGVALPMSLADGLRLHDRPGSTSTRTDTGIDTANDTDIDTAIDTDSTADLPRLAERQRRLQRLDRSLDATR
jgi:conjugal transfer pilus assembly protein TraB